MRSESKLQLKQMLDLPQVKLGKRGTGIACLSIGEPQVAGDVGVVPKSGQDGRGNRRMARCCGVTWMLF